MNAKSKHVLITVVTVLLGICSFGARRLDAQDIKIGFLLKTMQEERYQKDKEFFLKRAEELGLGAKDLLFDAATNTEESQIEKFRKMLDQGCQVIVLQPVNTNTAGEMVRLAHMQGVKVIGYDAMLRNGPLDMMVMQNSWKVGELQSQTLIEWLKKKYGAVKGKVVLIKGQPGDNNAETMSWGVKEMKKQHPEINILLEESHEDWDPGRAKNTALKVLEQHKDIDAFICNNSGLARGVISALEERGLADAGKIFVAGSDADLQNIKYILAGKQNVEIYKNIKLLANAAVEAAVELARHPEKEPSELFSGVRMEDNGYGNILTIVTDVLSIATKKDIDNHLIADGFFTEKEVYGE